MLSCAFIGCHPTRFKFKYKESNARCKKIKAALLGQTKALYAKGIRRFYVGGALGVDLWAGEAVLGMKGSPEYPDIELVCVIPFEGHDSRWDRCSRQRFEKLLAGCDEKITAGSSDRPDAHKARNYYMVDRSEYLIAVHDEGDRERSASGQAINYARKRKLEIVLIHPDSAQGTVESNKK